MSGAESPFFVGFGFFRMFLLLPRVVRCSVTDFWGGVLIKIGNFGDWGLH